MNWQEIREYYPHRWLVVEAINASTEQGMRIIPQLEVIAVLGDDWTAAWKHYKTVHAADIWREYYVLHTDREILDIGVLDAFGRVVNA